jgi:hypothetical protein
LPSLAIAEDVVKHWLEVSVDVRQRLQQANGNNVDFGGSRNDVTENKTCPAIRRALWGLGLFSPDLFIYKHRKSGTSSSELLRSVAVDDLQQ